MDNLRINKSVRRVIVLRPGASGALEPTVLYERQRKKKRSTRALRPAEKVARRMTKAQQAYWDSLAASHDRSNQKRRDGWARDAVSNMAKATRKGSKQLIKGL